MWFLLNSKCEKDPTLFIQCSKLCPVLALNEKRSSTLPYCKCENAFSALFCKAEAADQNSHSPSKHKSPLNFFFARTFTLFCCNWGGSFHRPRLTACYFVVAHILQLLYRCLAAIHLPGSKTTIKSSLMNFFCIICVEF